MEMVAQGVATYPELMSRSRKREVVEKRWRAWQILIDKGFNQSQIGRRFNMNHTSVYHGLKELKLIEELKALKNGIVKLK